jgi:NAD(P)-dependent dehydrogenase (short-subunit alcohol dehydrogenase family)
MPDADYSRWAKPEIVAEVILFLASDSARTLNGASIPV